MSVRKLIKVGDRHKHIEVVSLVNGKDDFVVCKCDCGNVKTLSRAMFLGRATCGCGLAIRPKRHGLSYSRIYHIWSGMNRRCHTPTVNTYKNYGAKGITVCDEWRHDNPNGFKNFYHWSQDKYNDALTIDRVDPDKGYSPDNCRWTDYAVQNSHHRLAKNHKTGYRNVYPTIYGTYQVIMSRHDKSYNVGSFKTVKDAVEARNAYIDKFNLPNPKQEYVGLLR